MTTVEARMDAAGKRIGVVAARWNELVVKELLEGALETLRAHGDPEVVLVRVPGAWEVPAAVRAMVEHQRVHAVVALGCILQGATSHAGQLAGEVGSALMRIQTETGVPVSWGILTPENQDQALERAGMKLGNKGREAAAAAVEMASLVARLAE